MSCCCRRCPNPEACSHNATLLAARHPHNTTVYDEVYALADKLDSGILNTRSSDFNYTAFLDANFTGLWLTYTSQLCDTDAGYQGIYCGSCVPGYGMTSPFQCRRCARATTTRHSNGPTRVAGPPSRGTISGLWVFYWICLTAWYAFAVWSSMPDSHGVVVRTACSTCGGLTASTDSEEANYLDIAKV